MQLKKLLFWVLLSVQLWAEPLCRSVILVIIDGARYSETLGDPLGRYTPRMSTLARDGVVVDNFINNGITVTDRAIPAIWTGSWIAPRDTTVNGRLTQYTLMPSIWEYYRKSSGYDSTQALYILKYLSSLWLPSFLSDYGPKYWPMFVSKGSDDIAVWNEARLRLQTYHPRLSIVYFADVDHAGHSGVWTTYTRAIAIADSLVGVLWSFVQSDPVLKNNTTVIVTNDHGRHLDGVSTGFKGHGDDCYGCRHIMLLALGPVVKRGVHLSNSYKLTDIAPTIGYILDFTTPHAEGVVITELFNSESSATAPPVFVTDFVLQPNYPNPFNNRTVIAFDLPVAEKVKVEVYDIEGKRRSCLIDEYRAAGRHKVIWEDPAAPTGVYFFKVEAGSQTRLCKGVLLK